MLITNDRVMAETVFVFPEMIRISFEIIRRKAVAFLIGVLTHDLEPLIKLANQIFDFHAPKITVLGAKGPPQPG